MVKQWRIPPSIKKLRDFRNWYSANMPKRSWCHKCLHFSARDQGQYYLMCTPHGLITQTQEFVAWIYALTDNMNLAYYMVTRGKQHANYTAQRARRRAEDLKLDHAEGKLDLREGPWAYYNFHEWPGPFWPDERKILDYGDLWRQNSPLYQQTLSQKRTSTLAPLLENSGDER